MFNWLKSIFSNKVAIIESFDENETDIDEELPFIWCLVGNIVSENKGTKHFTPNTKVFCFPAQWGVQHSCFLIKL